MKGGGDKRLTLLVAAGTVFQYASKAFSGALVFVFFHSP
jgi:hypothetical protein